MTASSAAVNPAESFSPQRGAVSSPWTQIARGESERVSSPTSPLAPPVPTSVAASVDPSAIELPGSSPDGPAIDSPVEEAVGESSHNGNAGKRPAWNKSSNGAAVAVEVGAVMGAELWPALSETTKALGKLESLKLSDGSSVSHSSSQRQVNPPNMGHVRQRSMKRNGGGNISVNGSLSQPPAPPASLADMPMINHSPGDTTQRSGLGSHNSNNHTQRNSSRNRNGGPHPRGDGSHPQNYGGRRDQDRSNQDWNAHRSFNGRDAQLQQHRVLPRFLVPPPPLISPQFLPQSSMQQYGSPIPFPEQLASPVYYVAGPYPESIRGGAPFAGPMPPPAVYLHGPDHHLHVQIVAQVDYYFSNENLIKDTYLRQNMDGQGWVPIKLIAGFKKLKLLTENIQLILHAVQASTLVEVQGDKIRRRNDWMRWIMPSAALGGRVQGLNLEKATNSSSARGQTEFNADAFPRKSESGKFNSQSRQASSVGTGQFSVPAGCDQSDPAIN